MTLALLLLWLHPYHVSVCEIVYSDEAEAVQITHRIFLDDLEKGVQQHVGNEKLVLLEDSLETHQGIENYLKEAFSIVVNGQNTQYTYLGGEVEDDLMWCYLEVVQVSDLKSVSIKNSLLTETYDDQNNLVHFKIGGDKKSFILTKKEIEARY